jgi:ABC-type dipeptide/oligopeptide/nickel transport system permease component
VAAFLVRRLLQAVIVLFVVSVLVFVVVFAMGDPVRAFVPINASASDVENIRHQYGLDQPLWLQYLTFLQHAATGDMGESFKFRESAMALVLERLPLTAALAITSIVMASAIAIPLGIVAATRRGSGWDHFATAASMLTISIPSFWLGILLILFFAGQLRWVPASGVAGVSSIWLPAITLAAFPIGLMTRVVRASVLGELRNMYMTTARAKGLAERTVIYGHALRNALLPIITVLGLQLGAQLGGSVIVETVFAWPGVGWLLIQAIGAHDLPLLRANVLVIAILFIAINAVTDVLYVVVNPRIRFA